MLTIVGLPGKILETFTGNFGIAIRDIQRNLFKRVLKKPLLLIRLFYWVCIHFFRIQRNFLRDFPDWDKSGLKSLKILKSKLSTTILCLIFISYSHLYSNVGKYFSIQSLIDTLSISSISVNFWTFKVIFFNIVSKTVSCVCEIIFSCHQVYY